MRVIARISSIALISTVSATAMAADSGWNGNAEFGYLSSSGNTDTQNLKAEFGIGYDTEKWKNKLSLGAYNAAEDDETTSERYTAKFKSDYFFTKHDYVFGALDWEKDLFGGVRERTSETIGYGRRLIKTDKNQLDAELGAGFRQQTSQKPALEDSDDAIGTAALKYRHIFSSTASFGQTVRSEFGDDNTFTEAVSDLKMNLTGSLFVKLSYTIKNNSDVPVGTEKTDRYAAVTLSYDFL